jgi:hypothetical protein
MRFSPELFHRRAPRVEHCGTFIGVFDDFVGNWVIIPHVGSLCFIFQRECAFLKQLKRMKQLKHVKQTTELAEQKSQARRNCGRPLKARKLNTQGNHTSSSAARP